jgi:alpha-N-acetylglucosaminidase
MAPAEAARALIGRVVPSHASQFAVEIIPAAENGHDVFEVESVGDKVVLRGNDGVSVASALNWYLKNIAHCHLSWCGDRIELPATLGPVPAKVRVVNPHRYRVMFNYCTLNYTASWWDQKRWERELDFLAMQGINTPLGVIGLEAVWYDTLLKYGFTDQEARAFLVGPAHSAWQWMTNIEGTGEPIPRSWVESRRALGKWWMDRARSLGMTPIRQGFSGYVPRKLKEKFPDASVALQPSWCNYTGSAQLDPLDPMFKKLGRTFMEESLRNFGEGHLWAADPFHESSPPRPGDQYLNDVGTAIFGLMREVDPKATWAMQAWSIRKPITDSVPKGALLVLDLGGGKPGFWGHDYVKGQLHNFGGRINLHGDLRDVAGNNFAARAAADPKCVGMGLFPEAIIQNPVFYECVYDMMWRDKPVNIDAWLHDYSLRRYGIADATIDRAWKILLDEGPYKHGTSGVESSSMIAARPALIAKKSGPNAGFAMPYKPEMLVEALRLLLSKSDACDRSDAYRYDVVDIARQTLSNLLQEVHKDVRLAYLSKDRPAFDKAVADFDGILADTDRLLATRGEFLFGKWIADARSFGKTPEEKAYFEKDATMLVTIWGPEKNPEIIDYSWREWSGLIDSYYRARWANFHAFLRESIDRGDYRDPAKQTYGHESFRASPYYERLADWELAYVNSHHDLPALPKGDAITEARTVLEKYSARFAEVYSPDHQRRVSEALAAAMSGGSNEGATIGKWSLEANFGKPTIVSFDPAGAIASDRAYEVVVRLTDGDGPVKVDAVKFILNGSADAQSATSGEIDAKNREFRVRLKTGANLANANYSVALTLTTTSPKNRGSLTVRKVE